MQKELPNLLFFKNFFNSNYLYLNYSLQFFPRTSLLSE